MDKGISRRHFLSGAALAGAAAAGAGLAGCAPAQSGRNETQAAAGSSGEARYAWEVAPDPITDVASTVDTDILVIGAGLAGCATACAAAEAGGTVTVVEKTSSWNGRGGGFGTINSRYMDELGIKVDKVNAKQHWIAQCASRANEDLIVKFFNHSEEASNWLLDKVEALGGSAMVGAFYSHDDVYAEQPGYHMLILPEDAGLTSTGFAGAEILYNDAVAAGARFVFDSPAVQLVEEGGAVTGCICDTADGYVRYNASKGVVLCTGDIGGDAEMCKAYAPICAEYGQPRSQYTPVGANTGDGHKMGMWVGAQLQDLPFPTMMHPQAFCWFHGPFLFVNDKGERFMCEDTWVQGARHQPPAQRRSVVDLRCELGNRPGERSAVRRRHVLGQLPSLRIGPRPCPRILQDANLRLYRKRHGVSGRYDRRTRREDRLRRGRVGGHGRALQRHVRSGRRRRLLQKARVPDARGRGSLLRIEGGIRSVGRDGRPEDQC